MKTALITGDNKSISLEAARQLLQHGYYVCLGSRDAQKGQQAVEQLKAEGLFHAELLQLDVPDGTSIAAARAALGRKTPVLDVLINNAGILGGMFFQPMLAAVAWAVRQGGRRAGKAYRTSGKAVGVAT